MDLQQLLLTQDYKDDNHKPEMALALEDFEALCGFVAPGELKEKLRSHEELKGCVGAAADAFLEADEANIKPVSLLLGQHCISHSSSYVYLNVELTFR
jgi:mannose-6-phosphate isomerase class I